VPVQIAGIDNPTAVRPAPFRTRRRVIFLLFAIELLHA
jgi:hypothetical protein